MPQDINGHDENALDAVRESHPPHPVWVDCCPTPIAAAFALLTTTEQLDAARGHGRADRGAAGLEDA